MLFSRSLKAISFCLEKQKFFLNLFFLKSIVFAIIIYSFTPIFSYWFIMAHSLKHLSSPLKLSKRKIFPFWNVTLVVWKKINLFMFTSLLCKFFESESLTKFQCPTLFECNILNIFDLEIILGCTSSSIHNC